MKRENWNLLFGAFFLVIAVLFVFINRWVDAAWSGLIGGGSLVMVYAQKHPDLGRGKVGWGIAIIYIILLVGVFILKLRTP